MSSPASVHLDELFLSFQGEGIHAGEPQLFVRLGGCPLRCAYCDTPRALARRKTARIAQSAASAVAARLGNPVSLSVLMASLDALDPARQARAVSFTGGEPLAQAPFLAAALPAVRKAGWPTHLETAGVDVGALRPLLGDLDTIAMDWKLPADTGEPSRAACHEAFLRLARRREACVKIVVTPCSRAEELREACRRIARVDRDIPLILQPVTPHGPIRRRPGLDQLLMLEREARRHLSRVRVLPQLHPILGIP